MKEPIKLWHGGARWYGRPEVQAPRKGRYECGPGIYLTSSYERAARYAKGGNVTTLVSVPPELRLLENTRLSFTEVWAFVNALPRLKHRSDILDDLSRNARMRAGGDREIDAAVLVNLCIHYEAIAGQPGLALVHWLVEQGIDAAWHKLGSQERWLTVFNPKVIQTYSVIRAADVTLAMRHLPVA